MHGSEGTIYDFSLTSTTAPVWAAWSDQIEHVVIYLYSALPTSTYKWFANMTNLQDITNIEYLHTDNVTNMSYMFYNCPLTSLDLSTFNTASATDMSYMFSGCSSLTDLNVSKFNTQNVTDMRNMFSGCTAMTALDLSSFVPQQVTNMSGMFQGCNKLTTIYVRSGWSTDGVVSATSSNMFGGCTQLVGENGTTFDASHTDKALNKMEAIVLPETSESMCIFLLRRAL